MKLLFLTSRLPYPPDRGDRLRAYHFLRQLAQEHEVSLVSFIAGEQERPFLASLSPLCQQIRVVQMSSLRSALTVGLNLWRGQPLQALYYRSAAMQQTVDEVLAALKPDLVYVHLFRMAQYVQHWSGYRVVDLTDVISQEISHSLAYRNPFWRLVYRLEGPRIARYEQWVAQTFEESWLITRHDQQVLARLCPGANIQVVPNGVDMERFRPLGQTAVPHRLIFVGHMGVFHNIDAAVHLATEVLPLVQQTLPDATLHLVGASPSEKVVVLGQLPGVTVTGFVDDLNGCLNESAVFVAPLRFAAGVQNKVLEAMAAGRAVVTSPIVNAGLGAQHGRELWVAEGAEKTAEAVTHLLTNPGQQTALGTAARAFVQQQFSWQFVSRRVAQIFSNNRSKLA